MHGLPKTLGYYNYCINAEQASAILRYSRATQPEVIVWYGTLARNAGRVGFVLGRGYNGRGIACSISGSAGAASVTNGLLWTVTKKSSSMPHALRRCRLCSGVWLLAGARGLRRPAQLLAGFHGPAVIAAPRGAIAGSDGGGRPVPMPLFGATVRPYGPCAAAAILQAGNR